MSEKELYNQLEEYDKEIIKLSKEIKKLEEENKRLNLAMQDTYDSANDICGKLQQRIDKAIEYIESYNLPKDLKGLSEAPISVNELKVLLNILKGE
jgi:predicted nuclease with TOPRIM domain